MITAGRASRPAVLHLVPPMPPSAPILGYLCIALAAALWGSLGVVSRVILEAGVAPLELSVWRASIAGMLFAAHAVARRRVRVERGDWPVLAAFAVIGVSLFYVSYLFAVRTGGAALAAILLYTAPAWVAIASAVWLHEPMTRHKLAALALTLVGVACVALGARGAGAGLHVSAAALGWGLLSGLAYASYYLFGKRYFTRYEAPTVFMYVLPLGALLLVPAVHLSAKSAATWGWIAFVGIVPTYVALQLYEAGLKRVEATRAVTVATLEPVVAAGLAYAVWGEALRPVGYAGAVLVLAGVLLMSAARTG
jgi:DME family drug/metabolite transporter